MKSILSLVATGFLFLSACGAQNQDSSALASHQSKGDLYAKLTKFEVDPNLGLENVTGAGILLKNASKRLELMIDACGANSQCDATKSRTYSADIVSDEIGDCGIRYILARKDARPVDGALTQIELVDYSQAVCDMIYPNMTEVVLKTSIVNRRTGNEGRTYSKFSSKNILQK